MFCQVKFGYVVGALRVTYVLSVKPYEGCRIDAAEVNECAVFRPVVGNGKGTHVGAYGIDAVVFASVVEARPCFDERRRVGVGVFHVAVDGAVVALHFPVGGNGDGVP